MLSLTRSLSRLLFPFSSTLKKSSSFAFDSTGKPIPPPPTPTLQTPFLSDTLTTDSLLHLHKSSLKQILHHLYLMQSKLTPRNHTIINQSCFRLLSFQKQIKKEDIIRVLALCVKAQVGNQTFVKHMESQLVWRFEGEVKELVGEFWEGRRREVEKVWRELEKGSGDVFGILNDPEGMRVVQEENDEEMEKEGEQKEQQDKSQPPIPIPPTFTPQSLSKAQSLLSQFGYISFLLIQLNVHSTTLLQLFQQLFLTFASPTLQFKTLLQFININNHILLQTQQEYEKHKVHYLKRSIKRIKKYQLTFYQKLLPIIKENLDKITIEQFTQMVQTIGKVGIKSNRPVSYLFEMFKDYSWREGFVYSEELMKNMGKLVEGREKMVEKLRKLNEELKQKHNIVQREQVKQLQEKDSL